MSEFFCKGRENIPDGKNYLFITRYYSYNDIVCCHVLLRIFGYIVYNRPKETIHQGPVVQN